MALTFWTVVGVLIIAGLIRAGVAARHPERDNRGLCVVDPETLSDAGTPSWLRQSIQSATVTVIGRHEIATMWSCPGPLPLP